MTKNCDFFQEEVFSDKLVKSKVLKRVVCDCYFNMNINESNIIFDFILAKFTLCFS